MMTTAFMKETKSVPNGESLALPVIRKEELNNNCCYTDKRGGSIGRCKSISKRSRTGLTIMFLASYLLISTVVTTSFVTSQPVTNLPQPAQTNKLTGKMATTTISLQQTILSPPSASSFYALDSSGNGNTGERDASTVTVTTADVVRVTAEAQNGVKNQHNNLSPAQPLPVPIAQQELKGERNAEKLSNPLFENGIGVVAAATVAAAAAGKELDVSAGNNGNDNVIPLTMTNTLRNRSRRTGATMSGDKWNKEGKKVGWEEDKDKVMLTDDVKGSSSTVNPVSSSSSSLSSQNGNSLPAATLTAAPHSRNDDVDNVDKGEVVYDEQEEKRRKVNIISATDAIPLLQEQQQPQWKENLIVNQSLRFMSTAAEASSGRLVTEKQAGEMTVTTITEAETLSHGQGESKNDGNSHEADYYAPGTTPTSGYANVVNNHVNFVGKKGAEGRQERRRTEKQQGAFDIDYSNNKTRTSVAGRATTPLATLSAESQSNDKKNGNGAPAAAPAPPGNGKSTFPSSAAADSSSTSPGNLMKSTRQRSRPVTEMNSISLLSPVSVAARSSSAADMENNGKEERSHDSRADGEGNSKEEQQQYNAHQQSTYHAYSFYDSPPSFATASTFTEDLTGDDGKEETNEDEYPPSPLFSQEEASSASPLLMNKWIKTLVKLSQCRANCLDQAEIHRWNSAQSDLHKRQENHADDKQAGEGATTAAVTTTEAAPSSSSSPLPSLPSASTPNWSDLNRRKGKAKTLLVYPEQMKEKERSHPLAPPLPTASTTTPGRTIKVTPGKSMKYYELSTCQQLCRSQFPLHPSHDDGDERNQELETGVNANGEKQDIAPSQASSGGSNNNIIKSSFKRGTNNSRIASAGNNGGAGNNGSNNNNADNNNSNENIESGAVAGAHDRKSNNNNHRRRLHETEEEHEQQKQQQQQQHGYNLPPFSASASSPTVEEVGETAGRKAVGGGKDNMRLMRKMLAMVKNREENKSKGRHFEDAGTIAGGVVVVTSSANNLEAFPSDPRLKVRQLSGRKRVEGKDESEGNAFPSAFPIFQLSWPGSREERDDAGINKSSKPEGVSAQVKDKEKGIRFEKNGQRPVSMVYSIIVEESWNEADGTGSPAGQQRKRWKLIDQTVARTSTQISLPLLPIVRQHEGETGKVQSEQKNNQKEKMSLTEQKNGPSSEGEAGALQKKKRIMKRNEPAGMKAIKPLQPPPLPLQDDQQEGNKAFFPDLLPSKVTLRVLAVSREGLQKVYSARVKVNNSFWDYHLNEQEKMGRHEENLNQEQADDSKTWTATDSHNNKREESSRPAPETGVEGEGMRKFYGNEKTGNQKKKESIGGGGQIGKVNDKLDEKVAQEKKGGDGQDEDAKTTTPAKDFNDGSNENSNQILVFPSSESLRQTLGRRGLSGEMKVKKLMTRLKQKKKKNENEVEMNGQTQPHHDLDHLSNLVENSPSFGNSEPEADLLSERSSSNRISSEVNTSLNATRTGESDKNDENEKSFQNWGLHTVSMIYQKFLVVTQVSWDYPGEEVADEKKAEEYDGETTNFSNSSNNANNGKTGVKSEEKLSFPALASPSGKKWKGCGNRASNSNSGSGVDSSSKRQEEEQQLNFLLSWEIFGGGLRGNLVTDTCSASISLWPDTVYIIQVGLITPNKVDPDSSSSAGMTKTNGEDSYAAYLTAWQEKARNQLSTSPATVENLLSNHVPHVSNYVDENNGHAGHDHQRTLGQLSEDNADNVEKWAALSSSSPSVAPSSFDPLVLPESITFPFDGEPKVTIKSERILVNTTRDRGSGSLVADDDLPRTIHNQDKVTPGNSQSNNNFPTSAAAAAAKKRNGGDEEGGEEENDEQGVVARIKITTQSSKGRESAGSNDKVNVSPITITSTKTGHFDNEPGPAFEEEEADQTLLLRFQQDQPEAEILPPLASLSRQIVPASSFSSSAGKVEETGAAGANEDVDQENSSVWSDEDEGTDQDESLFARSLAHQTHHLQKQHQHSTLKNNDNNNPPPPHFRSVSLPQPHTQTVEDVEHQMSSSIPGKSLASKFHSFMTVKSFYQSLYQSLSRNALELNSHGSRYPNVFTITGTANNEGNAGGKRGNGSVAVETSGSSAGGDVGPLLIGEFGNSNRTGYLFSSTHTGGDDDADGIKGKLYTLFVILVISFVIFLFVVAVVGFCVLTSSIKENYKYFVPKKVRVWTTVGQLIKGPNNSNQPGTSSSSSGGNGGGRLMFTDTAEGSFYPLQEEPDFDDFEEDNDDFDPDEDEEDVTSVAETEEEDEVDSECDCRCGVQNTAIVEVDEEEEEENSFSLNERCSSDMVKLIKDGEENSVELIAAVDDNNGEGMNEQSNNGRIGASSCNDSSSSSISNNRCGGSHHHHHQHHHHDHRGNCDNNNPCYHTTPGTGAAATRARIFQQSAPAPTVKVSPVAAALSSLRKNFHRVSSSVSKQQPQQQQHHHLQQTSRNYSHNHHHPHCQYYHHKRKSDTRIDVTGGGNSRNSKIPLNPRQEGYY